MRVSTTRVQKQNRAQLVELHPICLFDVIDVYLYLFHLLKVSILNSVILLCATIVGLL